LTSRYLKYYCFVEIHDISTIIIVVVEIYGVLSVFVQKYMPQNY